MCDLPAKRKMCEFLGQNATKGCLKCRDEFSTDSFGSKADSSGYNCDDWELRNLKVLYVKCIYIKTASTASERAQIEKSIGGRYTELSRLPYLDVIRHYVIDPMHNLFLGLAKHVTNTWKDLQILKAVNFDEVQSKMDSIVPPAKIGRIPREIGFRFSSFTADE